MRIFRARYTLLTQQQLDTVDVGHSVYTVISRRLRTMPGYVCRLEPIFDLRRIARKNQ